MRPFATIWIILLIKSPEWELSTSTGKPKNRPRLSIIGNTNCLNYYNPISE